MQALQKKGALINCIFVDLICTGEVAFSFEFTSDGPVLNYKTKRIKLADIGAAWYWRPIISSNTVDSLAKQHIEREMRKTFQGIWENIENKRWLNSPLIIRRTQNKLMQLPLANHVGLKVIPTIATNSWAFLEKTNYENLIIKMPGLGVVSEGTPSHVLYSTVINKSDFAGLYRISPLPGMYQPFLSKKKEWRVTIVGDKVFSAAIYTDKNSKDDWRVHSHSKEAVRFVAEDFPAEIAEKCKKLLQNLGLRYGAFDFIETEDDKLYFVEVNTNGQFLWLEKELGFPISDAIADELISIANAKRS